MVRLGPLHSVLVDPHTIKRSDEGHHCPDCTVAYPSAFAAASCDCNDD